METINGNKYTLSVIEQGRSDHDERHNKHYFKASISTNANWLKMKLGVTKWELIGGFSLARMPGCCGTTIFTGVEIIEQYRGKGITTDLVNYAVTKAVALGYSNLVATVNHLTPQMHKVLLAKGFQVVNEFKNSRTGNTVTMYSLNL